MSELVKLKSIKAWVIIIALYTLFYKQTNNFILDGHDQNATETLTA